MWDPKWVVVAGGKVIYCCNLELILTDRTNQETPPTQPPLPLRYKQESYHICTVFVLHIYGKRSRLQCLNKLLEQGTQTSSAAMLILCYLDNIVCWFHDYNFISTFITLDSKHSDETRLKVPHKLSNSSVIVSVYSYLGIKQNNVDKWVCTY